MDVISVIVVALCLITDGYILFSDDFLKWIEAIAVLFPEHYFYCI